MSKRLLLIDTTSNCLDIAMRAQQAGWLVKWYDRARPGGEPRLAGRGMIDKIEDYHELRQKWLDWADLIYLPDNTLYLDMLEPYRQNGYPILAPSPEAAQLELNRAVGQKAMEKAGMKIMESKVFTDYDAAISFAARNPTFLVSKPSGDADKALSYVAHDADEMVYMLARWKERPELRHAAKKNGFILQERKYGVEMAVGGWFGPHGFGKWFYENWEYKKLMDGDLGVATGEMGTLSRMVTKSKLADQVLLPMTEQFMKLGYVGFVDVNCIIEEGTPWPLEFTMRDGWPTKHNVTAHAKNEDPVQWMLDGLNGRDTLECVEGEVCVSVVVVLPDFPYSKITNKELCGIPIWGATDAKHIHLSEVMMGTAPVVADGRVTELPSLVTCGDYTLVVTATSGTIRGARESAYNVAGKVRIPNNPFYRREIGAGRMKRQLPLLHKHGYAKGLEF